VSRRRSCASSASGRLLVERRQQLLPVDKRSLHAQYEAGLSQQ
jgi:hypothetical protein